MVLFRSSSTIPRVASSSLAGTITLTLVMSVSPVTWAHHHQERACSGERIQFLRLEESFVGLDPIGQLGDPLLDAYKRLPAKIGSGLSDVTNEYRLIAWSPIF